MTNTSSREPRLESKDNCGMYQQTEQTSVLFNRGLSPVFPKALPSRKCYNSLSMLHVDGGPKVGKQYHRPLCVRASGVAW